MGIWKAFNIFWNLFLIQLMSFRNSATKTIEQSLLFCGAETGKMIALRNIIRKVTVILKLPKLSSDMIYHFTQLLLCPITCLQKRTKNGLPLVILKYFKILYFCVLLYFANFRFSSSFAGFYSSEIVNSWGCSLVN